jgi:preprotein translocase subunit YajC
MSEDLIYTLVISTIILGGLSFILYKVRKNEKNKKKWIDNIIVGDKCRLSLLNQTNQLDNLDIVDISDDEVTVSITVNKRWVYPPITK